MQTVLLVLQVVVSIALIGLILLQHGRGADAGAAFGSGASTTVFGSQGSGSFLTKATATLTFLFLGNSLLLGYLATQRAQVVESVMSNEPVVIEEIMPQGTDIPQFETPISDVPDIPTE